MAERTLVLKYRTETFPLTTEISFVLDRVAQRKVATEAPMNVPLTRQLRDPAPGPPGSEIL